MRASTLAPSARGKTSTWPQSECSACDLLDLLPPSLLCTLLLPLIKTTTSTSTLTATAPAPATIPLTLAAAALQPGVCAHTDSATHPSSTHAPSPHPHSFASSPWRLSPSPCTNSTTFSHPSTHAPNHPLGRFATYPWRLSPSSVVSACRDSTQRLGVDSISLGERCQHPL